MRSPCAEPFLEETLAAGFALDRPDYELIFCAEHPDDPAVEVVRRLMAAHPETAARLLVGVDPISGNPKLNNCAKGWRAARHDWVVLADSNVLMPPDCIRRLMAGWRPGTGLVCSPPLGTRPGGFWAEVECAFLNTFQARWQYAAEGFGSGFAHGKTMLWRRGLLEAGGGIRALVAEVAEDAAATKLVRGAGLRVRLVDRPFEQPLGPRSARQVWPAGPVGAAPARDLPGPLRARDVVGRGAAARRRRLRRRGRRPQRPGGRRGPARALVRRRGRPGARHGLAPVLAPARRLPGARLPDPADLGLRLDRRTGRLARQGRGVAFREPWRAATARPRCPRGSAPLGTGPAPGRVMGRRYRQKGRPRGLPTLRPLALACHAKPAPPRGRMDVARCASNPSCLLTVLLC